MTEKFYKRACLCLIIILTIELICICFTNKKINDMEKHLDYVCVDVEKETERPDIPLYAGISAENIKYLDKSNKLTSSVERNRVPIVSEPAQLEETEENAYGLTNNDDYLLAKIAMAESEGLSFEAKAHVIKVILNRVQSEEFPNTIKDVIYQKSGGTYQFSPIGDGRWYEVEPDTICSLAVCEALENVQSDALYFESCTNSDNWHSRTLQYLYTIDDMRFYK